MANRSTKDYTTLSIDALKDALAAVRFSEGETVVEQLTDASTDLNIPTEELSEQIEKLAITLGKFLRTGSVSDDDRVILGNANTILNILISLEDRGKSTLLGLVNPSDSLGQLLHGTDPNESEERRGELVGMSRHSADDSRYYRECGLIISALCNRLGIPEVQPPKPDQGRNAG